MTKDVNFMILDTGLQQAGENLGNSTNFAGQQWPTQTWYKSLFLAGLMTAL